MQNATAKSTKGARTVRFGFRATVKQEALIRKAAELSGQNVTQFVLSSACEAAERALSDQTRFFVDRQSYDAFSEVLERPVQCNAGVDKLFERKAPWE